MNTRKILTNAAITSALVAVPLLAVVGTASADPAHEGNHQDQWNQDRQQEWHQDQQAPFQLPDPGTFQIPDLADLLPQPAPQAPVQQSPVTPFAGLFTGSAG